MNDSVIFISTLILVFITYPVVVMTIWKLMKVDNSSIESGNEEMEKDFRTKQRFAGILASAVLILILLGVSVCIEAIINLVVNHKETVVSSVKIIESSRQAHALLNGLLIERVICIIFTALDKLDVYVKPRVTIILAIILGLGTFIMLI